MIRVNQLLIYPIKSCRGVEVDLATVGTTGFELDRRWMLIGDDGRFLSQREHHQLALVRVQLDEDRLRLEAPGLPSLEVAFEGGGVGPTSRVQVWDDECAAVAEGEDATIPVVPKPEQLPIFVCGDPTRNKTMTLYTMYNAVATKPVKLPANWDDL